MQTGSCELGHSCKCTVLACVQNGGGLGYGLRHETEIGPRRARRSCVYGTVSWRAHLAHSCDQLVDMLLRLSGLVVDMMQLGSRLTSHTK